MKYLDPKWLLAIIAIFSLNSCADMGVKDTTADWRRTRVNTTLFNRGPADKNVDSSVSFRVRQIPEDGDVSSIVVVPGLHSGEESDRIVDFSALANSENEYLKNAYKVDIKVNDFDWDVFNNFDSTPVFSTVLPIMIIDTGSKVIPDEPKIEADMSVIRNFSTILPGVEPTYERNYFVRDTIDRNYIYDNPNVYNGKIGIELRGHSSLYFCKKQYGLETRDLAGKDLDSAFFGMPPESDWVLHGPYSDKTLLRNQIAYDIWEKMGRYSVRTRYVEVFVSNSGLGTIASDCVGRSEDYQLYYKRDGNINVYQYIGVYLLIEKIKHGPFRVNIASLRSGDNVEPYISGGYILKIDKIDMHDREDRDFFTTTNSTRVLYVYPKPLKITMEQKRWISAYIQEFENVLHSDNFRDPVLGYNKYIDVASFVDFFLLQEVLKNIDGLRISTYFHKDRNGKLRMGPAWDFNLSMGNAATCDGFSTSGWYKDSSCANEGTYAMPFWWHRLLEDEQFRQRVINRWYDLRRETITLTRLFRFIDQHVNGLTGARKRNFFKWKTLGVVIWGNHDPVPATYDGEIANLKEWINSRIMWIDHNIETIAP